ncbi:MAG: 50S ribosomal protein L31 [Planctomycetes bacterium]|nr:50S ribosomal protein L31 [Planctomycetota bacterium]
MNCSCGNSFQVYSEREALNVEICSACHPYYTGQQKFVDSAGRVDRFTQRYNLNQDKLSKMADTKEVAKKPKAEKLAHKFNPKKKAPTKPLHGAKGGKDEGAKPAEAPPAEAAKSEK